MLTTSVWPYVCGWKFVLFFNLVSIMSHKFDQKFPTNREPRSLTIEVGRPKWTQTFWKKRWVVCSAVIFFYMASKDTFFEPIFNNIQVIMTFPWHWKTSYKIHWDTLPRMWRNRKWSVQSKFYISRLTYCTQRTSSNKTRYTINHAWSITIPLEIRYCLHWNVQQSMKCAPPLWYCFFLPVEYITCPSDTTNCYVYGNLTLQFGFLDSSLHTHLKIHYHMHIPQCNFHAKHNFSSV